MAENIWARFNGIANTSEVADEVNKFTPLEEGQYVMELLELAPAETKTGLPMLKGKFKLENSTRQVFYNQVLQNMNYPNITAQNIAKAVMFVGKLKGEEITYTGMEALANEVSALEMGGKYEVKVSYSDKDYEHKFAVLEVINKLDGFADLGVDENVPF